MKSQRAVKEIIKSEKLPQGQTYVVSGRRNKDGITTNVYTVKETTLEKRIKRAYGNESSLNKSEQFATTNINQGVNSDFKTQNKITFSNDEENMFPKYKSSTTRRKNISRGYTSRRYSKKEIEKIIEIQRWWRRILAKINGYEIRESFKIDNNNNLVKSQKVYTERYMSTVSSQSSNRTNNVNFNSKSYSKINTNLNTNMKKNLNSNLNSSSSSQNYAKTFEKRVIRHSSPKAASGSTSPSVKSKYIIETRKVEVFRKPKNSIGNKCVKETNSSISNYEVKKLMRGIWNNENYCSQVESLSCLADDGKSNISQNTLLLEEYEEEIRKLNSILVQKDDELNNLMANLKETKNKLNISLSKNIKKRNGYNQKKLEMDAHELQIISTKLGWNDENIPFPVNEIFIESIENKIPQRMQCIEGMYIMGKKQEESMQESTSDPEAVLEIQEMNSLCIISNKRKPKCICQHLQSLMILPPKKEEHNEENSLKEKEEKNLEMIPVEKEPLIFQKIEQINYKSKPKPRKPRNQIQELDGFEIIKYNFPKRKIKNKFLVQNIDRICLKSSMRKIEKNTIQELDALEIIKTQKKPHIPQCIDALEIEREYDMLMVKPIWDSLRIQGSGLNILALPSDMGLENQGVDEFEILGMEKPTLYMETLEQISIERPDSLQNIQVLIPLPENTIEQFNFKINGIKKKPEIKIVEKIIEKIVERKKPPNKIAKSGRLLIKGKTKVFKEKILKLDTFFIKGKEKIDNRKIIKLGSFNIKGKEKSVKNKVIKQDKFTIKKIEKIDNNRIINSENIEIKGKEKKVIVNKIIKNERIQYKGKEKKIIENKIIKNERIQYKGKEKKIIKNKIFRNYRIKLEGFEREEKEPEENIEESVIEICLLKNQKKIVPNKIKKSDRFKIKGLEEPKDVEKEIENIENLCISKAYSTKEEIHEFNNIGIGENLVINIEGNEKIVEKDWNEMIKKCMATKLFIQKEYEKVEIPEQEIIEKEEMETEEKLYKNWNDEIRPVKTLKLNIEAIEKQEEIIEKEREEFDIENFALNILDSGKKFRESLYIENSCFDLEGKKDKILKEIKKEQILMPSRVNQFNLISQIKKSVLKSVKENKIFINGIKQKQIQPEIKEIIKTVEKIVEVEKKIDWNKTNKIEKKGKINLLKRKKTIISIKQRTNSIILKGNAVQKKENAIHGWSSLLHAQRNVKFNLLGKIKTKKNKLLVANGDKFFILKESDDEIIYNDDYNTRKDKQQLKNENENRKQIIKEKEYVPIIQREIIAQVSKLKEESSETSSSVSEIDVLATIKAKNIIGYKATSREVDAGLIGHKKTGEYCGYQTKEINGEVIFTPKNSLAMNLGGSEYQKRIKGSLGYATKINNINNSKVYEIEIRNPSNKTEIYYQKESDKSRAITEGNNKRIETKQIINDKGLSGNISFKQSKVIANNKKNINSQELDIENNGKVQSYRKQVVITSKKENVNLKELNGLPNSNFILNSRTVTNGHLNIKKRDIENNKNIIRVDDSQNSVNQMNKKIIINQNIQNVGAQNKTITSTREYRMKSDNNERVITETKKTTEIRMKKK